jgi:hypothetical protein
MRNIGPYYLVLVLLLSLSAGAAPLAETRRATELCKARPFRDRLYRVFGTARDSSKTMRRLLDAWLADWRSAEVQELDTGPWHRGLDAVSLGAKIGRFADEYSKRRAAIDEEIDRAGFPARVRERIRRGLHARARWLSSEGKQRALSKLLALRGNEQAALENMTGQDKMKSDPKSRGGPSLDLDPDVIAELRSSGLARRAALTDYELAALHDYTYWAFTVINRALWRWREGDLRELRPKIALLASALGKLPKFAGTVDRVTDSFDSNLSELRVGDVSQNEAFMSTWKGGGSPAGVLGNVKLHIHSKTGREVTALSEFPNEREVLFAPGARFRVTKRRKWMHRQGRAMYEMSWQEI